MRIKLSDHFNYNRLLRFTLPSIVMMVFTSIYSIVDGLFVSNFVGKTPFAAINLVGPVFTILGSIGMMIGAGGTAIIGKTLGEKKSNDANAYFSMLIYIVLAIGVVTAVVGWFAVEPLSHLLGAEGEMLKNCVLYGRILFIPSPFFLLQFSVQSFFVTAEKPKLGLAVTILGGVTNILLDALFIIVFKWGIVGAALATGLSQMLATISALVYFALPNSSLLRLTTKTKIYGRVLFNSITNGASEMVGNIAYSIVTILYNSQLLKFYGEDGVAAYGVLMYIGFIFSAIYYGYSMGSAPIISFHYGAKNQDELKNLLRRSLILISIMGGFMLGISKLSAPWLSSVFVGYDKELYDLTYHALHIYSWSFLFMGFGAFGSSFFTALNNGTVSAAISFLRTFIFEIGSILLLPLIFPKDGIWFAVAVAEFAALLITGLFLIINKKKYHYF